LTIHETAGHNCLVLLVSFVPLSHLDVSET
jgi:hypothetical protein